MEKCGNENRCLQKISVQLRLNCTIQLPDVLSRDLFVLKSSEHAFPLQK